MQSTVINKLPLLNFALQIIQPPMSRGVASLGGGGVTSDSASKSDMDRGALECALVAQLKHPHVILAFKSAQVPLAYDVSLLNSCSLSQKALLIIQAGCTSFLARQSTPKCGSNFLPIVRHNSP